MAKTINADSAATSISIIGKSYVQRYLCQVNNLEKMMHKRPYRVSLFGTSATFPDRGRSQVLL
jgi:hypothetical protein